MTSEIMKMNQATETLLREYQAAQVFLSDESKARTLLMLGKMQEERGRLSDALEFYSLAIDLSQASQSVRLKARAARLRLSALLGLQDPHGDYLECSTAFQAGSDLQAELEHSLILADAQIFGAEQACERWQLAQTHKAHPDDENIFFYDLVEGIAYLQGLDSPLLQKLKAFAPKPEGLFEQTLHRWLQDDLRYSFKDYYELGKQLTLFSHLRLLAVALKNEIQDQTVSHHHLRVCLNALGDKNRKLMSDRCHELLNCHDSPIWNARLSQLEFQGHFLKIDATSLDGKILSLLHGKKTIAVEEILHELYDEEFSDASWTRLRVAVHRLDKKLAPFLGVTKVLKITKNEVLVTTPIQ
jgi:hypothetical protein